MARKPRHGEHRAVNYKPKEEVINTTVSRRARATFTPQPPYLAVRWPPDSPPATRKDE
jgi:hypothetical protein